MRVIERKSAEHYRWKTFCDGWHLVKSEQLSVIAEKMPPHTEEDIHLHHKAKQFFYILSGNAVMKLKTQTAELQAGMGIEIEPGEAHQMMNVSDAPVEFLVVSMPMAHGDKEVVTL